MSEPFPSDHDLDAFGDLLAASAFGGAALGIGLLGVQVFMVLYATSVFLETPKKERSGRLRFIIISYTILVTSSVHTALDAWGSYRVLYKGGPDGKSYVQAHTDHWATYDAPMIVGDTMGLIMVVQGDLLMLWRCFILWRSRKWILLFPFLTFIGATGIALAPWPEWYITHERIKSILAGTSLSVATNVLITGLILYRLVQAWMFSREAFPGRKSPHIYSDVVAIIIESAAPLTILGICFITAVAIAKFHPPKRLVERGRVIAIADVFNWLYYNAFCALSPQMIIFRVTAGKSWRNAKESHDGAATFSKPIQFASDATGTRSYDSEVSQGLTGNYPQDGCQNSSGSKEFNNSVSLGLVAVSSFHTGRQHSAESNYA
ncbi:hypothetical protein BKA70DRAFT_1184911 [Coprinopsis sp. MPI-PUGE-AT-0042]|nr:hypothetical protein BKA70DRAFT_1184911 [Coprinopsis sp. MPI-PUGE-AT-0042]